MVIPNMVMKFHNFDIFYNICWFFDLSSALACRVESINIDVFFQIFIVEELIQNRVIYYSSYDLHL